MNETYEAQKELRAAIREAIPLDEKDARHERLADAIERIISQMIFDREELNNE